MDDRQKKTLLIIGLKGKETVQNEIKLSDLQNSILTCKTYATFHEKREPKG
jgi:hypothetical protein